MTKNVFCDITLTLDHQNPSSKFKLDDCANLKTFLPNDPTTSFSLEWDEQTDGWTTQNIMPGQATDIAGIATDNAGPYPKHCHIIYMVQNNVTLVNIVQFIQYMYTSHGSPVC